jgi:GNAT superfamily N-acetyltransferase
MARYELRPSRAEDAAAMAATVHECMETYRSFVGPGWSGPSLSEWEAQLRSVLARDDCWCLVAEVPGAELAGHVGFVPAARSRRPVADPFLAHFWQLFVRPAHWGTGVAGDLHARATEEAGRRGFTAMRLFTPADQARARRFYEREGWMAGETLAGEALGLDVVEYRLGL